MQQYARIKSGVYGKHRIKDAVFPLVLAITISSSAAARLKKPSAFEDLSLLVVAEP